MSWGIFVGGFLAGTAGVKLLRSKGAKKVCAHTTAAVLRAKDGVMKSAENVKNCAGDILAEAKEINARRDEAEVAAQEAAVIIDTSDEPKE